MTMTYKFPMIDLSGKAPVKLLKPFLLVFNNMIVAHDSCVLTVSMSGYNSLPVLFTGGSCALDPYFLRVLEFY